MTYLSSAAPDIHGVTISGRSIRLSDFRGKKVLVKFHRFSGCPVARRQLMDFIANYRELQARGYETLILLVSPAARIIPVYREVPGLHIIGDADRRFYRAYDIPFSWARTFSPASWREIFRSFVRGYLPLFRRFGTVLNGMPGDFLVDTGGCIVEQHYGGHAGDSWTVADVVSRDVRLQAPTAS